ncbi:MAG TPA: 30S ribosomal protein S6, partial [Urbifossiella sp.]|nr:30S ribosomal protein S6 [Urbifossiella sp.]
NTYETMFLLDATKLSADGDAVRQQVHHLIERHGGHIVVAREWNYNQKLAYPIEKQKKGAFHIVYYTLDSLKQQPLERDFALAEGVILRQMTLKLDLKWQETILGIARDEHGKEFAVKGMQDEAQVQTDPSALGAEPAPGVEGGPDGGPRGPRGRRPEFADKPE